MNGDAPSEWFHPSELVCPRCGQLMEPGFLNAGKGPFRWVLRPDQHETIFGGDHIVPQQWVWGRHVVPAARCRGCQFGVFATPA